MCCEANESGFWIKTWKKLIYTFYSCFMRIHPSIDYKIKKLLSLSQIRILKVTKINLNFSITCEKKVYRKA